VRSSADLQIDRARLGLLGHGSGAHMAVSLALEPALLERTGVDPHAVQTLIAIAGFYGNPKKGRIHDAMTGGDQDLPKAPLDLALKGATGPATLFLHGEGDRAVGLSHSVRMASVMAAAKTPVRLRLLDKTGHWGALYALSWAAAWRTTVLEETRRFASARFSVSTV
jgi:acetyl esterase/lipase